MLRTMKFLVLFTAFFLFILGCEKTPTNGDDDDSLMVEAMVDSAISALETEFYTFINMVENDEIEGLDNIDFTPSNALFKEALLLDAENLDANFGAGLTELLVFSQDPDVQAVFDAWEAFLDTGSAFVADTSLGSSAMSLGLLLPGALRQSPFQTLNEKEMAYSYLNLYKLMVSDPPTIGDIQDVVESVFLPSLDYALERFDVVDDSSTYSFIITPKMQGDVQEDPVEFDLTEVYVLEVAMNLLRSFCSVAVAYNVSPSAYDSAAIVDLLKQGSGFLSLRTTGATQMGNAKQSLLDASSSLDNAISFLKAETDDQSDDIIIAPTPVTDLDSITEYNADFRDYLENGVTLTEDWNDDGTATDLTFNFSVLFENPIQDFKSLLPDYTVEVGRDTSYDYEWESSNIPVSAIVNLPETRDYWYNRMHRYNVWEGQEFSEIDTFISIPEFDWLVDSLLTDFRADASLSDWYISIYWWFSAEAGEYSVNTSVYYSKETRIPDWSFYTGILSFVAGTYSEWEFHVDEMNGFISEITTDQQFKDTFGITEADFLEIKDKQLVIPFEFFSGGIKKMMPAPLARTRLIPWAYVNQP